MKNELTAQYEAGHRDFSGQNFSEGNLIAIVLQDANLENCLFSVSDLSNANLSGANLQNCRLNVARLRGANLQGANLQGSVLNVANMIRANLSHAHMAQTLMVRAELIRSNLRHCNLESANLTAADLREVDGFRGHFNGANLGEANLQGSKLEQCSLEEVNLTGANLSECRLVGAKLRGADLKQANLEKADLRSADLRGANLRWANLKEANLEGANLQDAKLSGANLQDANLQSCNLINSSLIHTDLTNANLGGLEWTGADLSGAILTGVRLYNVSCFGLKTENLICEWLNVSPDDDDPDIFYLNPQSLRKFFQQTQPLVKIAIDGVLDLPTQYQLLSFYYQLHRLYDGFNISPSVEVSNYQTIISFKLDSNQKLFETALTAILPFSDRQLVHRSLLALDHQLKTTSLQDFQVSDRQKITKITNFLSQILSKLALINNLKLDYGPLRDHHFFNAPTQTTLMSSGNQSLPLYYDPDFGKHVIRKSDKIDNFNPVLPSFKKLLSFLQDFFPHFG